MSGSSSSGREVQRTDPVADPARPRSVIDYAMQRRATLRAVFGGGAFNGVDICDADPYLLRAARFHGEPAGQSCPICRKPEMVIVRYVYGEQLGHASGSAYASAALPAMASAYGEFRVFEVEVCPHCRWNHLLLSYVLGDGVPRRPPRRPRDLID